MACFFFFQAEDGIRDADVTGVQTCALPIFTLNLLRDLRNGLSSSRFIGRDRKSDINWQLYKLKGTFENKFGDIALIVNINYRDGTSVNGAAFLEAKKRDWRKTTFGTMKLPQAKKILKNAPHSQYLLYDYEEITNFLNGDRKS